MPEQIGEHFTSVQRFYPSDRFPDEIDALDVPETYVSVAKGDCLEPAFHDGDYLVFSKSALLHKGDYVGIWFAPDIVPDCETPRQIKRLAMEPMSTLTLPWSATSDDELEPHVHLEMFNPPRKLRVPASRLVAMHKVVGIAEPNGDGTARPTGLKNRLPILPWCDSTNPDMISHCIQDDLCEPLFSVGDCILIDTSSKTAENGELFLVQWSTGNRQIMQLNSHEFNGTHGKFTGWMITPFRRPRTRDAADKWTKRLGIIDWCSDGPYTDDGIAALIVGRVVGRCDPAVCSSTERC